MDRVAGCGFCYELRMTRRRVFMLLLLGFLIGLVVWLRRH